MNYRLASLLASESATTAATKSIDLNLAKPISRITVQFKGTNNGNVPTAHPAKMISKLEIVDGSNVLYSASGIECQAVNYYENGSLPVGALNYENDVMAIATFQLNFGRFLWDEVLAFDPSKFVNPQLRISHNLALGGSAPDAATMNVIAYVFDDKDTKPVGFLMTKEQYSYTLAASAKERVELATDLPYRAIMLQSLTAGKQPWEQYNQVKLDEDNGNRVVINDEKTSDLLKFFQVHPPIVERIIAKDLDAPGVVYCTPTYDTIVNALGLNAADTALFTTQSYGGSITITGTDALQAQLLVSGIAPHGALWIPTGKQNVIEDFYDVKNIGNLDLVITAGSGASGTCQIVTQQVKNY
ncbi:MAG: hypothetical protein PHI16_01530 [Methanocellales archaeon]|nr:hypothetical protein [Methanocellales archaeon]